MRRAVLIIDDSPSTAGLARLALTELGCRVELATSADEGMSLARGFAPGVITFDAYLPGITAAAFCVDLLDAAPEAAMIVLLERGLVPLALPPVQAQLFKPLEPRRFAAVVGDLLSADELGTITV